MKFLSVLASASQQRLRRLFICVGLTIAGALSGAVGLGFATYALFEALRLQYGVIDASLALAAIYLVLAAVFYLILRRVSQSPYPASGPVARPVGDDPVEAFKAAAGAAAPPQAAAIAMGIELARQLRPLQLALLAALSGFAAGRKL
jgi:hypothetical protein